MIARVAAAWTVSEASLIDDDAVSAMAAEDATVSDASVIDADAASAMVEAAETVSLDSVAESDPDIPDDAADWKNSSSDMVYRLRLFGHATGPTVAIGERF